MGAVHDTKNKHTQLERDAVDTFATDPFDDSPVDLLASDGARARPSGIRVPITTTLLASARHELRSPLQSIQGFAELLGSEAYGALNKEQQSFVGHIVQGSIELGAMLDACLELGELAVASPALELVLTDAQPALADALEHAGRRSGTPLQTRYCTGLQTAHVLVDQAALRRAFQTLHTGLTTGPSKTFRADVALADDQLCITFSGLKRVVDGQLVSVDEYARRRQATRALIWLRLASSLLAAQRASLLVTEQLDCAEVRIHLSSTH